MCCAKNTKVLDYRRYSCHVDKRLSGPSETIAEVRSLAISAKADCGKGNPSLLLFCRFSKDVPQYREVVFGTLKRQAFYIAKAPYANAYRKEYVTYDKLIPNAIRLNRTEWISTYNYELDSGCYFIKVQRRPTLALDVIACC